MIDPKAKPAKPVVLTPVQSAVAGVAAKIDALRSQDANGHKVKPDDFDALQALVSALAALVIPKPADAPPSGGGPGEEK